MGAIEEGIDRRIYPHPSQTGATLGDDCISADSSANRERVALARPRRDQSGDPTNALSTASTKRSASTHEAEATATLEHTAVEDSFGEAIAQSSAH
jgi:hypothetical protein